MTSFNSDMPDTDDEIIKYCSNLFLEISETSRQVYRQPQDSAHSQSYRRAYVTLHHICDKRVKHSETYISFIRNHAEQLHRGISLSKLIFGRNRTKKCRKFRIRLADVPVTSKTRRYKEFNKIVFNTRSNMR